MPPRKKFRHHSKKNVNVSSGSNDSDERSSDESQYSSPRKASCQQYMSPARTGSRSYSVTETRSESPLRVGILKLKLNAASDAASGSESETSTFRTVPTKPSFSPGRRDILRTVEMRSDESNKNANPIKLSLEREKNLDENKLRVMYQRKLVKAKNKLQKIEIRKASLKRSDETLQHIVEKAENLLTKIDWLQDNMSTSFRMKSEQVIANIMRKVKSLSIESEEMKIYVKELKAGLDNEKKGLECLRRKCLNYLINLKEAGVNKV